LFYSFRLKSHNYLGQGGIGDGEKARKGEKDGKRPNRRQTKKKAEEYYRAKQDKLEQEMTGAKQDRSGINQPGRNLTENDKIGKKRNSTGQERKGLTL
jgi:hypothetical protein